MALPFLPGNSPNERLGKERFHKSQHFDYSSGVPMLVGSEKPGIGGEHLVGQEIKPKYSVYPIGSGTGLPPWVTFDKQVLCFDAYFQETVPEAQSETYRIRKCKIYFFLEDDTIQVVEPEYKNSGIPQGTLIRRHRIPLPPPNEGQFYNLFHFNINQQMKLHSRTFTVTDCDSFTRNFLTKLGVHVNNPTTVPEDPYSSLREQLKKSMQPLRPYERHDTLKQFLDHDRKVLRFYCFWDDSQSIYVDLRELILHYFLVDDTIEIREVIPPNSGRDKVNKFLRRCRLPKHVPAKVKQPGEITDRTVLNVLTSSTMGNRYILDSLKTGAVHEEFYKDCDLIIGGEVNVWGRRVILADCDDFTKHYYRAKYGIEDFTPLQYKAPPAPKPPRPVPPYNGFGSEEDSLSFCQRLLPKPPRKDFQKFMAKDRYGLDSKVLNFQAKMITADPVDRERVFIISFYLSNDTISVFERPQKNSGVLGGKFLERGRVKKPGQELFKSQLSQYFTAQDLYVGATLCLNSINFQLLDADEYTFKYMEQHAEEFPRANMGIIISKLRSLPEEKQREIRKFLTLSDPSNTGFIPFESIRSLLLGLDCNLSEHEVLVLGRCFSEREQTQVDVGLMLAVAQDFLKKKAFEEFPKMARAFADHDRHKTQRLSTKAIRTICKAFHLPVPNSLLEGLLSKFADGDEIDYYAFLAGINWLEHPAPPVMPEDTLKFEVDVGFDGGRAAVKNINYSAFLQDAFSLPSNSSDTSA
ncbi:EF-hand domain-containing family member C2 isoform X2 [Haplochromis burtoni]|uniref:EF-hand domain-containing family member C2 isoform X2 n=1 Tax=Haplochromis burtoni TaxID=8153 RepID=UPI0006C9B9DA|nr:EF-hand domain-containing family member C2 isoform X2 [Haplochromis burtoni]